MKKKIEQQYEIVVCGGGLAGFCAAVAAARLGSKTCIIQDRPVFGGNSSSEIRVTPHGSAAFHAYSRETGIISELLIEERANNHEEIFENGWTNSVWDLTLYDMAVRTSNLYFHLNTRVTDIILNSAGSRIKTVIAEVANAETLIEISGDLFIDCTGDGFVANMAKCAFMIGTEGKDDFGELRAPLESSNDVMGSSIHFRARDTGHPVSFTPPRWAILHEDSDYFYNQGRKIRDLRGGYWWIEISKPWDTIYESQKIRHELTRHTLGIWDWIKNKDPKTKERARNYALDWIGQVPGKRESRRIVGEYILTENDIKGKRLFDDEIAFGGWHVDLHTSGGLLADHSSVVSKEDHNPYTEEAIEQYVGPYSIPLRILIARDVDNLLVAGRNISASHRALGSLRVMGTTSLMGQAAGTAAAVSLKSRIPLKALPKTGIKSIQQALLREDCFLLNCPNEDEKDLARMASVKASSEDLLSECTLESANQNEIIGKWMEHFSPLVTEVLDHRRGQLLAIGSERIESLSVLLSNRSDRTQEVCVELVPVDGIWDYRVNAHPPLASDKLQVPPGKTHWTEWKVNIDGSSGLKSGSYVRLDLLENPNVEWHIAGKIEPAHVTMFEIGKGKMRCYEQGVTMCFKIDPPQPVFPVKNVLNGWTRPYRFTNMWRSSPHQEQPAWIELEWEDDVEIREIHLTFPGNILREYIAYPPFYRDPQCARDYSLEIFEGLGTSGYDWREIVSVENNYQRHRRHILEKSVKTKRLRLTINATNGDKSAGLYEIRCYS